MDTITDQQKSYFIKLTTDELISFCNYRENAIL